MKGFVNSQDLTMVIVQEFILILVCSTLFINILKFKMFNLMLGLSF